MRTYFIAFAAAWITVAAAEPAESRGYLHVVVDRLPQCGYGVGYEQPMVIELREAGGAVVAVADHGGLYMGDASLRVSLYAPDALAGRYEIAFGRCPSLRADPAAAVRCDPVDFFDTVRARLEPTGLEHPQIVRPFGLTARCLDQTAARPAW